MSTSRQPATPLTELSFSISGRVARSCAETYEAVADPEQLSRYFTTGGARGRLAVGSEVTWDFHDFPGRFPVTVLEADPPRRLAIRWGAEEASDGSGHTTTIFEFAPLDGDTRTLVTITESSWRPTPEGAESAFDNCAGWTEMLLGLKAWVEHGITLREGYHV